MFLQLKCRFPGSWGVSPSGGFSILGGRVLHPGGVVLHLEGCLHPEGVLHLGGSPSQGGVSILVGFSIPGGSPSGGVLHGGVLHLGGVPCDLSHHAFDVTCMLPPHQLRHTNSAPAYILLPGHVACKACWDTHPPSEQNDRQV